jgi:hypothetical protein
MWGKLRERRHFHGRNRTTGNTRITSIKLLKLTVKYIISLLVKDTHDRIFRKNTSIVPVGNGSSLNIQITMKIIALTNRTLIETSVLVLYLLIDYLIFNPPLLCTSSWRFVICLPPIYNLIEFSPNDQIQPKLFLSINRIDIYISSHKFMLSRSIPMEVRLSTFPLS